MDLFDTIAEEPGKPDIFDVIAKQPKQDLFDVVDPGASTDLFDIVQSEKPSFMRDVVAKTGKDVWEGVKATPGVAASLATGIATGISGIPGIAGIVKLIQTGDLEKANKAIQNVSGALTFQPKDRTSIQALNIINKAIKFIPEKAGDITLKVTGSPHLAAAVAGSVEIGEYAIAGKIGSSVKSNAPKAPVGSMAKTKHRTDVIREFVQDDWISVKRLVKDKDTILTSENNPYAAEIRMSGRLDTRVREAQQNMIAVDKKMAQAAKDFKIPDAEIIKDVNRYLIDKHAPEANAALYDGAAGITTKNALIELKAIEGKPHFKAVQEAAAGLIEMHKKTLDVLLDSGVIDQKTHTQWRKQYPNHVPLQRVMPEEIGGFYMGRGLNVKGTGIKARKGSELEVADVAVNIVSQYKNAVTRAEKNIVDMHTLKFARDNNYFGGLFKEIKPTKIGKSFDGGILYKEIKDPSVLTLRENGKQVHLKINDPNLATALRGVNRQRVDGLLSGVAAYTRFFSSMATRFNVEFPLSNKIRDLQEMLVYAASKKDVGFASAAKTLPRDPASAKAIVEHIAGKDTPGAKTYKQMLQDGGSTGGLGLSTRKMVELDLKAIRKTNRSPTRQTVKKLVEGIENWNLIFEDSTRLSVYKQALADGLSRERAAVLAKESTINFNKMGTGGPAINALWMFSNASIQGSVKMLRAMKNPKVAGAVITTVGTAVYAANNYNDQRDPAWRDKVSHYDRLNGLNFVLSNPGEDFRYITLPTSWGLKPIKVAMESLYDVSTGYSTDTKKIANDIATSFVEGYNPVGGTDIVSGITPTFADLPVELARNKKWTGSRIEKDFPKNVASIRYFESLKEKPLGNALIKGTKELSDKGIEVSPAKLYYAYKSITSGPGRTIDKILNITGGEPKSKLAAAPFTSRFYRHTPKEEIRLQDKDVKSLKERIKKQTKKSFYDRESMRGIAKALKKKPSGVAEKELRQIFESNKPLGKKIVGELKQVDLTYKDSLIKQLGVVNGERAKFLLEKFNTLKTTQDKSNFYNDMVNKKLITMPVYQQLEYLLNKQEGQK